MEVDFAWFRRKLENALKKEQTWPFFCLQAAILSFVLFHPIYGRPDSSRGLKMHPLGFFSPAMLLISICEAATVSNLFDPTKWFSLTLHWWWFPLILHQLLLEVAFVHNAERFALIVICTDIALADKPLLDCALSHIEQLCTGQVGSIRKIRYFLAKKCAWANFFTKSVDLNCTLILNARTPLWLCLVELFVTTWKSNKNSDFLGGNIFWFLCPSKSLMGNEDRGWCGRLRGRRRGTNQRLRIENIIMITNLVFKFLTLIHRRHKV